MGTMRLFQQTMLGRLRTKRFAFRLSLTLLLVAFLIVPAQRAAADDESDDLEVKVQSVIEAVDCEAMPQTLSVLGLTIDINNAIIGSDGDDENGVVVTCADLMVGQAVEVALTSDLPDASTGLLVATEVEIESGECDDSDGGGIEISAPIQAIDLSVPSVTVLGIVVDISQANLDGEDDEASECENRPVDLSQLVIGQYVELKLITSQPPLVASALEVKNFNNEIYVKVIDEDGDEVDDGDDNNVSVDVVITTKVKAPAATAAVGAKRIKKVVSLHKTSNGSFTLSGLPTGRAKIFVTRGGSGQISTAKRTIRIKGNRTKNIRMRLKTVR